MKPFRWRLRPLVVLICVAVTAAAFLAAYGASRRHLTARLAPALPTDLANQIVSDYSEAFLAVTVIAIIAAAVIAILLSAIPARALARVRDAVTSRARGTTAVSNYGVAELQNLAGAVDRLAREFEERASHLQKERDELSLLVASVSEGILLTDRDGRILHANPAARDLLGLPADSRGRPLVSLVRNVELRRILERLGSDAPQPTAEVTVDDRRLLVVTRPTGPVNGRRGAVIALLDLTEVRRLEGVRRDFVANVSHELKTPLTSIRGYVETLLSDDLPDDMRRQFLDVVQKNAERLHSIVEDLLDLSRLESGGWRPDVETVSTATVISDAWNEYADRAANRHIAFAPPEADALVIADASALRQIMANLFDNAIRHTPDGGAIRVRVANGGPPAANGTAASSFVSIRVEDTGTGIPRDSLPRIFERFYRVDPARSRSEGGTGLGLSIVKHLTEAMGGEVSAESDLGKGTSVQVSLPAAGPPS
jgi:PAS domain S-box-containing protein